MEKMNAEWFQSQNTGRFITWLKSDHSIRGEGADRGASTRAFLKACEEVNLSKIRKAYRIRRISVD